MGRIAEGGEQGGFGEMAFFDVAAAEEDVGVVEFGEDASAEGEALAFVGAGDEVGPS